MQSLPNIEKSAFKPLEYVGYAGGTIWRIKRAAGGWRATHSGLIICARTLAEMSSLLHDHALTLAAKV